MEKRLDIEEMEGQKVPSSESDMKSQQGLKMDLGSETPAERQVMIVYEPMGWSTHFLYFYHTLQPMSPCLILTGVLLVMLFANALELSTSALTPSDASSQAGAGWILLIIMAVIVVFVLLITWSILYCCQRKTKVAPSEVVTPPSESCCSRCCRPRTSKRPEEEKPLITSKGSARLSETQPTSKDEPKPNPYEYPLNKPFFVPIKKEEPEPTTLADSSKNVIRPLESQKSVINPTPSAFKEGKMTSIKEQPVSLPVGQSTSEITVIKLKERKNPSASLFSAFDPPTVSLPKSMPSDRPSLSTNGKQMTTTQTSKPPQVYI